MYVCIYIYIKKIHPLGIMGRIYIYKRTYICMYVCMYVCMYRCTRSFWRRCCSSDRPPLPEHHRGPSGWNTAGPNGAYDGGM